MLLIAMMVLTQEFGVNLPVSVANPGRRPISAICLRVNYTCPSVPQSTRFLERPAAGVDPVAARR